MSEPSTSNGSAAGDLQTAASGGHRQACAITDALLALLDRIDAYLAEHGEGCGCEFCNGMGECGIRAGVAVADTLSGSVALVTLLAGAMDAHVSDGHPEKSDGHDADLPNVVT